MSENSPVSSTPDKRSPKKKRFNVWDDFDEGVAGATTVHWLGYLQWRQVRGKSGDKARRSYVHHRVQAAESLLKRPGANSYGAAW